MSKSEVLEMGELLKLWKDAINAKFHIIKTWFCPQTSDNFLFLLFLFIFLNTV